LSKLVIFRRQHIISKLKYQNQLSEQTLEQGLVEYWKVNDCILNYKNTEESKFFFIPHDVCHVIFGCSTSLKDEAITDAWTLFGTDVSLAKFIEFNKLESHKEIIKKVGTIGVIKTFFISIPRMLKVVLLSFKMKKKWKWEEYEKYMDWKLSKLRTEFNIKIV